jgi:Ca2+-transporting ATPase
MTRRPRPSTESIISRPVILTSGLVGLYMAICLDVLIHFGGKLYHSTQVGSSIGLSAFALMLIIAAYQCRSVTLSTLASDTFDNVKMNWTAAAEIALAVMITQMDLFNRLLATTALTAPQFGLALATAVGLFVLWEVGKLIARRQESAGGSARPSHA